jgi:hypothetical protein
MRNIKTFNQLFESSVQLRPSFYWSFDVFFPDKRIGANRIARFLVSGNSSKSITTEFLENLLPQYLGFDSLYTLSPDVAPPEIDSSMEFEEWVHDNIDDISNRVDVKGVNKIYIRGIEIANGLRFSEFLNAFKHEEDVDTYTEMHGDPNHIAWLIMNYAKRENLFGGNYLYILEDIFDLFDSKVGNSIKNRNGDLTIWEKYPDILNSILDSKEAEEIYDYFKVNPLELHIIKNPKIKEKILLKTGIKDYSKLGKSLRSGLI